MFAQSFYLSYAVLKIIFNIRTVDKTAKNILACIFLLL